MARTSGSSASATSAAGHREGRAAADLGLQPRLHGEQAIAPQDQAAQLGARGGLVEAHERLALLDHVAFLHQHLGRDAALEVLDLLVLAGGDEGAGHDDGAVERRNAGPDAEAADADEQDGDADHGRPA